MSKAEIKKKFRDVIFIEDDDGNLVKYVRAKENEKPQSNVKSTPTKPAHHKNASKKPKCNVIPPTPSVSTSCAHKSNRKAKATSTPSPSSPSSLPLITAPEPLTVKPYEIETNKMCSIVLVSMTENDIAKEIALMQRQFKIDKIKENLKQLNLSEMLALTRYAFVTVPQLRETNGQILFESVTDNELQRMHEYFTEDFYGNDSDIRHAPLAGFVVCWPGVGKTISSTPMWKSCDPNPLANPMFELGSSWVIELQSDGNLSIGFPVMNGQRKTLLFSELVWRTWLDNNENNQAQSSLASHSVQHQSFENINSSLSVINTSEIARLFGDDSMLAAFFSMDWKFDSNINISIGGIVNSTCGNIQPNIADQSSISTLYDDEDNGYDASIEVGCNQFIQYT